jgi:pseudouridylate synthase
VNRLRLAPEVAAALDAGRPLVALESTIISHGLPRPDNLAVAREIERAARDAGAVPATVAVVAGQACVGLDDAALEQIASREDVVKVSVRDLGTVVARGGYGATTVAATAHLAARAGIAVFATGGLGGVHREAHESWDVSADLTTLSRTPVTVVCAGVKSILDVPATLEYLETLNVALLGYRTNAFPGFYLADSGHPLEWRVDTPGEVAAVMAARAGLGLDRAALVVAVPARLLPPRDPRREPGGQRPAGTQQRQARCRDRRRGDADGPFMGRLTVSEPRVICLGDLMVDVVTVMRAPLAYGSDTPAAVTTAGGGSAANVAAWLAATGVPVAFAGRAGADLLGRSAVRDLEAAGVRAEVTADPARPTGTCVVLVSPGGERSMLPDPGANATLRADDLPDALFTSGRHLHLSGYALLRTGSRDAASAALELARARHMTISVDPSSAAPLAAAGPDRFLAWTAGSALCLANEEEASVLTGRAGAEAAAEALTRHFGEVVVKLGPAGAMWCEAGTAPVLVPAERASVVDTTGAGDAFAAGFLASWLDGGEPAASLRAGCLLAARAVTQV